jgi:hypothetical protein
MGAVGLLPIANGQSVHVSLTIEQGSLALSQLPLAQPDPWAATVLVDELDTGGFQCSSNYLERGMPGLTNTCLKLMHRYDPDTGAACQILLAPLKQASCCSALC